ncbi:hypothetical protein KY284_024944 [Solanum tuberosum]|nr:hypothetical protein KY284_024944 [Solanum tuberosum]
MKVVKEAAHEEFQTVNGRGRGRGRGAETGRGRGVPQHSQTSSEATCIGRGLERAKRPVEHEDTSGGQTRPFKRPRMVATPVRGFKWKGKTTITCSNLERMSAEKIIQTRSTATAKLGLQLLLLLIAKAKQVQVGRLI